MKLTKRIGLGLGLTGLLCSLGSAQTFTRLIGTGDVIVGGEPGETVTRVDNVDINEAGDWAVEVDGSGDTLSDGYCIVNGVIAFEEGTSTGIASPAGWILRSVDTMDLNDAGDQLFTLQCYDTMANTRYLLVRNGVTLYETYASVCTAPGPALGLVYVNIYEAWQNNNNQMLFAASVDDAGTQKQIMLKVDLDPMTGAIVSETMLAMAGEIIPGQTLAVQGFSQSKARNAINDNGDVLWMVDNDVAGNSALNPVDSNIYINNTLLYNEGDAFPTDPSVEFGHFTTQEMDMNNNGDFVFSGTDNGGSSGTWAHLYKSIGGVITIIAERTQPVPASIGGGLLCAGSHFGGVVPISNTGDVLWYLDTDDVTTQDTYLLFNEDVILQEGVSVLDTFNVQVISDSDSELAMTDSGNKAIVELFLTGPGDTVYMIEGLSSSVGTPFCDPANANSALTSATLTGSWLTGGGIGGGLSDLHLECTGGVSGELGYFLVGSTASDPGMVVSNGELCIAGGPFYRYNVFSTTSNSVGLFNGAGVLENFAGTSSVGPVGMETGFDVPATIPDIVPFPIMAGDTWHFQVWYRDTPSGAGNSNFSNGLSVTF